MRLNLPRTCSLWATRGTRELGDEGRAVQVLDAEGIERVLGDADAPRVVGCDLGVDARVRGGDGALKGLVGHERQVEGVEGEDRRLGKARVRSKQCAQCI